MSSNTGLSIEPQYEGDQALEVNQSQSMIRAQQEIQGAIIIAKRFPRNEDKAFVALQKSCNRPAFADEVVYSYPRGKKKNEKGEWVDNYVEGPSVDLAREAARCWGNLRHGFEIVTETEEERHIRGFAWDIETNTYISQDTFFRKLIQRKVKGSKTGETEWVVPDERDLLELTNRHGAKADRNCTLQVLPKDYIADAIATAKETLLREDKTDPEEARKKLLLNLSKLGITVEMIEQYLRHPWSQSTPQERNDLRAVGKSIKDGNSTWAEYVSTTEPGAGVITQPQARDFSNAWKASGYTIEDAKAFLKDKLGIDSSLKISPSRYEWAMHWANTPKNAQENAPAADQAPAQQQPVADGPPSHDKTLCFELFGVLGYDDVKQAKAIRECGGDYGKLLVTLKKELPTD